MAVHGASPGLGPGLDPDLASGLGPDDLVSDVVVLDGLFFTAPVEARRARL